MKINNPERKVKTNLPPKKVQWTREAETSEFQPVRIEFNDDFAPSLAEYMTTDATGHDNPLSRHFFYNAQLHTTLADAIARAVALGFPRLRYKFGLGCVSISDDQYNQLMPLFRVLCEPLKQGTTEWLYAQCYLRWTQVCWAFTIAENVPMLESMSDWLSPEELHFRNRFMKMASTFNAMLHLGAAARELELHLRNRADALRGKVTKRSAEAGGASRRGKYKENTDRILAEMKILIDGGKTASNAALIVFQRGVGASASANRAIWQRHKRKL